MFKLLPPSRFLYASDYPYINFEESLSCAQRLFIDAGLSASESEAIFRDNSLRINSQNQY